jgi:hypothetical protein
LPGPLSQNGSPDSRAPHFSIGLYAFNPNGRTEPILLEPAAPQYQMTREAGRSG